MSLETLAADLNRKLNSASANLNGFAVNTTYKFNIYTDQGEFKKATRDKNNVTKYINGVLTLINSDKTISGGVSPVIWTEIISAKLDLLIPDINLSRTNLVGSPERFSDIVRRTIDNALSDPNIDSSGTSTLTYSYANTGTKEIREGVGESLTLTVFLNYYKLHGGVAGSSYYIKIEDENIRPTRLDVSRSSTQGAYTRSDKENYTSGVRDEASALVISLSKPISGDKGDKLDKKISDYLIDGVNDPFTVVLYLNNRSTEKKVIFADSGDSAEPFLAASTTCTLVEYLEI